MLREPVSAVDAAWFRMDSKTNPMVITSVLAFEGRLEDAALDELVARLVANERFRQRFVPAPLGVGHAHWTEKPGFAAGAHVQRFELEGGEAALLDLVSGLMSTPLDRSRPLWQLHVVDQPEGTSLVARVHHAVGDGVALVGMLLAIVGVDAQPESVGLPPRGVTHFGDLAARTAEQAMALGKLLFLPSDPRTLLKGRQSARKRAALSRPIELDALRRVASRLDAKVNDVLLASVTAALRDYLGEHGGLAEGLEVHAVVPVFLQIPGAGKDGALGNHFGLVFAKLPLGADSAAARVRAVKQRMDRIKASEEASVAFAILAATGVASPEIERIVIDIFSRKGSVMVTNVPGPPVPLAVAGHALRSIAVWAPTAGHIAVGVSLVSYAGKVRLSIASDTALVPDPESIVQRFERDVDELLAAGSR